MVKKSGPRLRYPASRRGVEFTQPWHNLLTVCIKSRNSKVLKRALKTSPTTGGVTRVARRRRPRIVARKIPAAVCRSGKLLDLQFATLRMCAKGREGQKQFQRHADPGHHMGSIIFTSKYTAIHIVCHKVLKIKFWEILLADWLKLQLLTAQKTTSKLARLNITKHCDRWDE